MQKIDLPVLQTIGGLQCTMYASIKVALRGLAMEKGVQLGLEEGPNFPTPGAGARITHAGFIPVHSDFCGQL